MFFYSNVEKLKNDEQKSKKPIIEISLTEIKENLKLFCEKFEINKVKLDEFNEKLDNIGKNKTIEPEEYEELINEFDSLFRLDYQNKYIK